jgi:hypothetical protein
MSLLFDYRDGGEAQDRPARANVRRPPQPVTAPYPLRAEVLEGSETIDG